MPMQSRTDQVHSYQFFLHRVISGLVAKESDPAELPFRRLGWSAFGSIMVMVLIAAGFGVYGLYVGGGATSWQDGESVIVEKGTEAPYIYRAERLHPMLNVVSARLALGSYADVARVSARSLEDVPRGPTLGIPGAPEGLPENGKLLNGGWTFCSQQRPDSSGGEETISVLGVGRGPDGGRPAGEQAVLVSDASDGALHLLWHGHRFVLAEIEPALRSLGFSPQRALPVAAAWLDTLPVGESLEVPAVPAPGEPSEILDALTGQVVAASGTYYLVRVDALVEITQLQAVVVLAAPVTQAAYPDADPYPREDIPPAALAGAPVRTLPERTIASPPETPPEVVSLPAPDAQDAAVCAVFEPGGFTPQVWAGARLPQTGAIASPGRTERGAALADYVVVRGGWAALVQTLAAPGAPGGSWHLVTDQGVRYGLPAPDVAGMLGYDPGSVVLVPAPLLSRLPAGPVLDPNAAALPVELAFPR